MYLCMLMYLFLGISDINNLLSREYLRFIVWAIAVFTVAGNVRVILKRTSKRVGEESTKPIYKIFMGNLAGKPKNQKLLNKIVSKKIVAKF